MNERWQQLTRIFDEARQLPIDARAEFVTRACEANADLGAEVLSLLTADDSSGGFMADPALEGLAQAMASEGRSLRTGEVIGPYTIHQLLGSGGAGEVWRARDERLGRDVAIKVLLPHFASDADRLRRFADEARTAGALNHSNILTVFDVGEYRGMPYIVSECLEGRSLRQRLEAGPIAIEEARAIALGIARGLAAAHGRSIVHRDLKPENTFLRSDGAVKILDFGLAKLQLSLESAPTGTHRTMTGVILGTAGYMAPEQVKGEDIDPRADLFALGVMLYEMLGNRHPFRGASTFETLHAVLTIDPPMLSSINPRVPVTLGRIVMRLLEKAPEARFQSALDVIWALEQADTESRASAALAAPPTASPRGMRSRQVMWAIVALTTALLGTVAAWALFNSNSASPEPRSSELTRFTWQLPSGMHLVSAPAVSPDSKYIAFVGGDGKTSRLYVRDRGSLDAVMIPGTEGAQRPFWSPDSTSLGFFASQRLMKVAWQGGAPVALAEALSPFGGTWSPSGTIVFARDVILEGLFRVGTSGESLEAATTLDTGSGDTSHCWPVFLADGVHFLYVVRSAHAERRGLYLGRIDRPAAQARSPLLQTDSNAMFVPLPGTSEGALLYVVNSRVEARRFDYRTMSLVGDARTIAGVSAGGTILTQPAMLSASADVLAFATTPLPFGSTRLEAVDRKGQSLRFWPEPESQHWPRVSPDGRYLARQRVDALANTPDIWVEDLERGTKVRVTSALEPDIRPAWSQDGRYLAYVSGKIPYRQGKRTLSIAAADGTGVVRTFPCPGEYCEPTDWTSRFLLVNVLVGRKQDVWIVPTAGESAAKPLLNEPFDERDARMAPDGQWVAYVSDESGRPEVSLRTISGAPRRIAVSSEGGDHPVWRRDGGELFFVDAQGELQSVAVQWSRDVPTLGLPGKVNVPPLGRAHWGTPYDVSPDGSRIYMLRRNDDPPPREIHVVIGWRALLGW